jgi:hypothetical protein
MYIFVYICASFTRWVYLYIEGCLVVSTVSGNDLIRSKVACVRLRVINACVQVWSILVYKCGQCLCKSVVNACVQVWSILVYKCGQYLCTSVVNTCVQVWSMLVYKCGQYLCTGVVNACVQVWSMLVYKYLSHANATFRLVTQCPNWLRHRAPPVERVEHLKYLGKTLTNQNSIQDEVKNRLKPGNACYHSVQNRLSSTLLSKNVKLKIERTKILPVFYMGVKLGRSLWGRNIGWRFSRTGCWYCWDPSGMR